MVWLHHLDLRTVPHPSDLPVSHIFNRLRFTEGCWGALGSPLNEVPTSASMLKTLRWHWDCPRFCLSKDVFTILHSVFACVHETSFRSLCLSLFLCFSVFVSVSVCALSFLAIVIVDQGNIVEHFSISDQITALSIQNQSSKTQHILELGPLGKRQIMDRGLNLESSVVDVQSLAMLLMFCASYLFEIGMLPLHHSMSHSGNHHEVTFRAELCMCKGLFQRPSSQPSVVRATLHCSSSWLLISASLWTLLSKFLSNIFKGVNIH